MRRPPSLKEPPSDSVLSSRFSLDANIPALRFSLSLKSSPLMLMVAEWWRRRSRIAEAGTESEKISPQSAKLLLEVMITDDFPEESFEVRFVVQSPTDSCEDPRFYMLPFGNSLIRHLSISGLSPFLAASASSLICSSKFVHGSKSSTTRSILAWWVGNLSSVSNRSVS